MHRVSLSHRRLYLCTPDRPDLASFLAACIDGGVDVVQFRDKHLEARALVARARVAAAVCADRGVPFVLNDRPDLALEAGADGVHVGQDDAPVEAARAIVGEERLVGRSTHSPAQLDAATGVDYVAVGPIRATPTKPGRPAVGLDPVRYAAAHARVPFFAIGGIDLETVRAARAAGASRIAVVRALSQAADPGDAASALRAAVSIGDPVGAA